MDPTLRFVIQTKPTEGPDLLDSIPNPVAKRCSMNEWH
jgi:hypothetical protein